MGGPLTALKLAVLLCVVSQLMLMRFAIELRFLGDELKQMLNRTDTTSGASG